MTSPIARAAGAAAETLPFLRRLPGKQAAHRAVAALDLALLFGRLATHRSRIPPIRFFIFGQGRSGSTLLVDLLNSSPEVWCEKEILSRKVPLPAHYVRARSTLSPKPIYGFKVKIYQLTLDQRLPEPRRFLETLQADGWKTIYLRRSNVLRQSVSNLIAEQRRLYHERKGAARPELGKLRVELDDLLRRMQEREDYLAAEAEVLRELPYVPVEYETDLLDPGAHQRTLDRLFDFIGTSRVPVSTELKRINDRRLADLLENFDEVADRLAETRWAPLIAAERGA